MNKRLLGRTHMEVSELGLNLRRFGHPAEETASAAVLDAYHELGGRFIQCPGTCPPADSACAEDARAEQLLAQWLRARPGRGDDLVLGVRFDFNRPAVGGSIAFANMIRECCESSMRRLNVGHIDLLVCNWNASLCPVEDVIESATQLMRAGMVRYVVAEAFPLWRVVDSIHRSRQRNHCRFEAVQADFSSLSGARIEADTLEMCSTHRLGLIVGAPLGGELAAAIAGARHATPNRVALAWALSHPAVTSALITATSAAQLRELVCASRLPLTDAERQLMSTFAAARHRFAEPSFA